VWSTPTIDPQRGVLYITSGDNYSHPATAMSDAILALDLTTGRIVWSQQTTPNDVYNSSCGTRGANCPEDAGPDYDYGSSAMLVHAPNGRDVLVAGQKSGVVYALDPSDKGKRLWDFDTQKDYRTVNAAPAKGGSLDGAGPVVVGGMMFVNSGYPRFGGAPGNVLLAFGVAAR
jgi:outer membrane protein assembly factor BamB